MNKPTAIAWLGAVAVLATVAPIRADSTTGDSLTIYNQNMAVVRQDVPLNLAAGDNQVKFSNVTAQLEPETVQLRDSSGAVAIKVLEQNYLSLPVSMQSLLDACVGQTIDFVDEKGKIVQGKLIRSGAVPSFANRVRVYEYGNEQNLRPYEPYGEPIVEVDGKLKFGLPGQPHFGGLPSGAILSPTLAWVLATDKPGPVDAELSYLSHGLTWDASYDMVIPANGGPLELTAWATITNTCGRDFDDANIKLMAGDVHLVPRNGSRTHAVGSMDAVAIDADIAGRPAVTEKTFDEYHLYTLNFPASLKNGETKQVEMAHSDTVVTKAVYEYDGAQFNQGDSGFPNDQLMDNQEYGTQASHKVAIFRVFKNSKENGLGIPLPKGTVRFSKRDDDGQLEFLGDNHIDHTPKDELVRIYTGDAFDLTGNRVQTNYIYTPATNGYGRHGTDDESFKITLQNHKSADTEVKVIEHLYRGQNWAITANSDAYLKTDSRTIEFLVTVPALGSKSITYTAHYTW